MKIFLACAAALILTACANQVNEPAPCPLPERVNYFNDVYPIIDRTCAIPACHVNGFAFGNFKNATEVKKVADNGKLEFMIVTRQMPAGFTKGTSFLTNCEIKTITTWIRSGASIN